MGTFLKIFAIFWVIWIIWYITGGPLRDDKTHPYIGLNKDGELQKYSTSTIEELKQ